MKNVLITGANGFIGKNLMASLAQVKDLKLTSFDTEDDPDTLFDLVEKADFIFHLAGVNRPLNPAEFRSGNFGLTQTLIAHLLKSAKKTPLLLSSSIQATQATQSLQENPYGLSKKEAEDAVFHYGKETGAPVYVFRLPNVFGKWSRPNYNSAVATFCHNIARELPVQINDPKAILNLVYIDDVVKEFIATLNGDHSSNNKIKDQFKDQFCEVHPIHSHTLLDIVNLIQSFKKSRADRSIPDMFDPFTKKLYSTYLSFLPKDQFNYPLQMHNDERGSFTEFIKTTERGQVSINISKPGITKGNHWHHTKNEKFLVVSGTGTIKFRQVSGDEIITYHVSGDKLEVVDIPTGYTHSITNTGSNNLVTVMWANEAFDPEHPDTCFLPVVLS